MLARSVRAVSSDTAKVFSPKTNSPSGPTGFAARPSQPKLLVRENVLLGPAFQVEQGTCRKKIKAALRQLDASLARQNLVESRPQRMQVTHVGSGIA